MLMLAQSRSSANVEAGRWAGEQKSVLQTDKPLEVIHEILHYEL